MITAAAYISLKRLGLILKSMVFLHALIKGPGDFGRNGTVQERDKTYLSTMRWLARRYGLFGRNCCVPYLDNMTRFGSGQTPIKNTLTEEQILSGDLNYDGLVDVLDIVLAVNIIFSE